MYSQMFARFQTVNLSTNFLTQIGYFTAINLCGLGIFVFAEVGFKVERGSEQAPNFNGATSII